MARQMSRDVLRRISARQVTRSDSGRGVVFWERSKRTSLGWQPTRFEPPFFLAGANEAGSAAGVKIVQSSSRRMTKVNFAQQAPETGA